MELKLYNTMSATKEVFKPLHEGRVSMYHCGPTVYNFAHIGNLRSYVFADTIRRTFEANGYEVKQVINITDVGHLTSDADTGKDKIEEKAKRENKSVNTIADFYTEAFMHDLKKLNVETSGTHFPKASEHIDEQITLIQKLEAKELVYKISDGMYFDTARFRNYGKLGNVDLRGLKEGARVEINSEKRQPTDFALWKFSEPREKRMQEWKSPWGIGFPGWHIECSAMSMKYLGETFDIHTGGIDHIPIHHNNEIAQSEAATDKPFVNYWLHNAFVNIDGSKIAKSASNFSTLTELESNELSALSNRYWLLTSHYRSPVNFTLEAIGAARKAYNRLSIFVSKIPTEGNIIQNLLDEFYSHTNNDFDTPQALALVWKLIRDKTYSLADKKATILKMDEVLGLKLGQNKSRKNKIPKKVMDLVREREEVRKMKDFTTSDKFRDKILELGFDVRDTENGPTISPHEL